MNIHIALTGEPFFSYFGIEFTNTFILAILCAILIIGAFLLAFKKKEIIPGKVQNLFEFVLDAILGIFNSMTGDSKKTEEIFPLSATLFIFILLNNLMEVIPGLGIFHFLRSPSSDLHFTLALAIFSIGFVHFSAVEAGEIRAKTKEGEKLFECERGVVQTVKNKTSLLLRRCREK
jgi:F-type H+-transporting ATPase subunit a